MLFQKRVSSVYRELSERYRLAFWARFGLCSKSGKKDRPDLQPAGSLTVLQKWGIKMGKESYSCTKAIKTDSPRTEKDFLRAPGAAALEKKKEGPQTFRKKLVEFGARIDGAADDLNRHGGQFFKSINAGFNFRIGSLQNPVAVFFDQFFYCDFLPCDQKDTDGS